MVVVDRLGKDTNTLREVRSLSSSYCHKKCKKKTKHGSVSVINMCVYMNVFAAIFSVMKNWNRCKTTAAV